MLLFACFYAQFFIIIVLILIGILPAGGQRVRPGDDDLVADEPRCCVWFADL